MAKFFISMSGEGRGHATRVRSLVERMRHRHEITLFAPGEAYEFLKSDYGDSPEVRLVEIPGLKFHYVGGRLHLLKTIYEGLKFKQVTLPRVVRGLVEEIQIHRPDVILTDFEPALPRAAEKAGRAYLSLTHQHFLLAYDLSWLPWQLRFFAWFISLSVPMHYSRQQVTMISSFFPGELRPRWQRRGAIALGPMIRPEVRASALAAGIPVEQTPDLRPAPSPAGEPFFLSYLRKNSPPRILDEFEKSSLRIKVYGLGEQPPRGALSFHPIHPRHFVEDLVACSAVVSAAGNQLLGECMYLGKPVLALPETWHHEQLINAHFLRRMGCGEFVPLEHFTTDHLLRFRQAVEGYRTKIEQTCLGVDGTADVIGILEASAASGNGATVSTSRSETSVSTG